MNSVVGVWVKGLSILVSLLSRRSLYEPIKGKLTDILVRGGKLTLQSFMPTLVRRMDDTEQLAIAATQYPALEAGHFLFTSESVGEGHPGTINMEVISIKRACRQNL